MSRPADPRPPALRRDPSPAAGCSPGMLAPVDTTAGRVGPGMAPGFGPGYAATHCRPGVWVAFASPFAGGDA